MNTADVYARLTPIFENVFDRDDIVLRAETNAGDIEEWDSLSHIQLVVATEKEFGVRFTAAEIGELENVGQFVGLILRRLR